MQRYYSVVFVAKVYCTLIPLANSFADPWYWVSRSIFPWYFPYKRKNCNMTIDGIILYCKRDCESMPRKCSGFSGGCIPSSFQTVIKGLAISLWTQPIVWVNHVISVSLYTVLMCFCILFIDLTVYLLLLYGPIFLTQLSFIKLFALL